MTQKIDQINDFLLANFILDENDPSDIFVHGFNLPDGTTIEEFSNKLFTEGIKKPANNSILSTIMLLQPDKSLSNQIGNYVSRGRFRVILRIPETLQDLYLGKCKKKYNNAGNQYEKNSLLDFLDLDHIPSEFIVGIVFTDKMQYAENEKINYQFIQNPNYYDHITKFSENSEKATKKIKEKLDKDKIIRSLILGEEVNQKLLDALKSYDGIYKSYEYFIKEQEQYLQNKDSLTL